MKIVPTMRWFLMYSLLAVGGAGGGAYWFVTRSDDLLKAEVLKQLVTMFPDVAFDLDRANFDLSGRVRASRLRLTFPGDDFSALTVSELIITLDRDLLAESQAIQIQRIRLVKPRAWVIRHTDETWNWQRLKMQRSEGSVLPDVEMEHGAITVQFEQSSPQPALELNATEFRLTATPSSDRSWAISCTSRIDNSEPITVRGDVHTAGAPWKLTTEAKGWVIDQGLISKLTLIRPELRQKLLEAESKLTRLAEARGATREGAPIRLMNASTDGGMDLGVQLLADFQVRVGKRMVDEPLTFQVQADIRNGRITNPLLPLPLHELTGKFYADPQQIVLQDLQGRHGETTISCSAKWSTTEQPAITLHARRVVLDELLADRLPGSLPRLIRSLSLRGLCDIDAQLTKTDVGFIPKIELKLTQGRVTHEKFPYPVHDVTGKIDWHGDMALLEGQGLAGTAPVKFHGTIKRPGPGAEMTILIQAKDVPIDAAVLQAVPPVVRDTIKVLNLRGQGDAWVQLVKPAGVGAKIIPQVSIKLNDCSVLYGRFPLRIERVSGLVRWDGETATFENLRGRHADADISGHGSFTRGPAPGKLELSMLVTDVPFDSDLLAALPPRLQEAWQEFQPVGRFDGMATLNWSPGGAVDLKFPKVTLKDAKVTLKHFPFPWYDVAGEFSYANDRLEVHSLSAVHDDCRMRGKGRGDFPADAPWKFKFHEFFVDDLPLSPALRRALPDELRTIVETLNPTGTISFEGPVAYYGPNERRNAIAVEWQTSTIFSGSSINVGQRLDNVHGRVTIHGSWDGSAAVIHEGQLDLDSLEVFGHQLTQLKGPFRFEQGRMIVGSPQAVAGPVLQAQNNIPWTEQVSGKAIDGTLTLNAIVDFELETHYRLRLLMIGGNLERYAQTYLPGQQNIRGTLTGWLDLQGIGEDVDKLTGSGRLEIRPAELYELPVFVQIFQVLGPQLQDRTAFKEAIFLFNVNRGRFNFQSIDLAGNAIRLIGRGYVRFDGIVALEFFSMMARNRFRVPIVSDVIGMLSNGWVGVKVSGHISDPAVDMRAIPELDNTLRQFLGAFEPRLMTNPTPRLAPRTGQPTDPAPK